MPTRQLYRSGEPTVISMPGKIAEELCPPWPRSDDPTFWQPSSPDEVRDAYDVADSARGWQLWQRYLRRENAARDIVISRAVKDCSLSFAQKNGPGRWWPVT